MIINTNSVEKQELTIQYIRNLTHSLKSQPRLMSQDSLQLSHSESDSLNIKILQKNKKKKKKKRQQSSKSYVSPYKQSSLSIQKIMTSRRKSPLPLIPYHELSIPSTEQKKKESKPHNKTSSPPRYRIAASLIQKYDRSPLVDEMRRQARQIYQKRQAQKLQLTNRQKKQRWADFLLRQRRWESKKQDRIRIAEQKTIAKQKQEQKASFTAREYPKMDIEQHIRLVHRKKTKLKEQLKSNLLNYYTWTKNASPLKSNRQVSSSKPKEQVPKEPKSRLSSKEKTIHLHTKHEVQFLVNKNRQAR